MLVIKQSRLPEDALFDLLNRDAALWVCGPMPTASDTLLRLAKFMVLPWRVVLCEPTSSALVSELARLGSQQDPLSRVRGFVHIVAVDPSTRQLPPRCLPIFLLNGRDDATERAESSGISGIAANRRRLNMVERLEAASPKRVIVLGADVESAAKQLAELWTGELRSLVTFVAPPPANAVAIASHFEPVANLSSISVVAIDLDELLEEVVRRSTELLPDSQAVIRVRSIDGEIREVDITSAELIEQPLLDSFEIIKSKDLRRLTESDLTTADLETFFDKSKQSWHAFSAGLPWIRDRRDVNRIIDALAKVHATGSDENVIFHVISEAGAGGTTFARTLAFEAASNGYPTLLAKAHVYEPNATELASFLYRALQSIGDANSGLPEVTRTRIAETPWLVVLDREQWDGQEQAVGHFLAELVRSGRSVVIVKVLGPDLSPDVYSLPRSKELCTLTHELDRDQAEALGQHLNRYLKSFGSTRGASQWLRFWDRHRPDIDTNIASFWITLEFWLKGFNELGDSIQEWLLNQFKNAPASPETRLILLELAALTVERRAVPEQLLPVPQDDRLPLSFILENLRASVPGLALIRQDTSGGRLWATAHDVLGRYLVNAVYHDRLLLKELGLDGIQSSIELRLHFISRLTSRKALGERRFTLFAVQFAVKTLKLDEPEGNAEFFQFWRDVISILERFPESVRRSNRTFIHHVAISRRRVAKNERFGASVEERRTQLSKAIEEIEYALRSLDEVHGDESNLNLYNSLALAYQDLASLELEQGGISDLVRRLRAKANEATLNALRENPTNPYVLETAAKNLLQQGKLEVTESVSTASQALGYIFQATTLENSAVRQHQLGRLATEALMRLKSDVAGAEIARLRGIGDPMGYLASAWIELTRGEEKIIAALPTSYSEDRANAAVAILREAPRHWLLVRLQYDLFTFVKPNQFEEQLSLLDELDSMANYRLPIQLRLERAILLHLAGRHSDANDMFKDLRRDIKQQSAIVSVPQRLRWLVRPDRQTRILCNARVTDNLGYRPLAQVVELKNAQVPFIPQDFGRQNMPPGMSFRCQITFGAMGPFIKPPQSR